MAPLTCIIAEDESFVRERIAQLATVEGLLVIASVAEARSALQAIHKHNPAIAFLDIRMPGMSGLALANALSDLDEPPVVVFVTAFAEHALAAFELSAVDYVLKPIETDRFAVATQRAVETALGRGARRTLDAVSRVLREDRPTRIVLRNGSGTISVPPSQIVRFAAADDYVEAHLPSSVHLLSVRLDALERVLVMPPFARVHRSHIVNLNHVAECVRHAGRWVLSMEDGAQVPVARSRERQLPKSLRNQPPV